MDKKFTALTGLFFLSFLLFVTLVVFNNPLTTLTRASEESDPSAATSKMIVYPLTLPADGKSESTITVFVANSKQKPLPNKVITASTTLGDLKEQSVVAAGQNAQGSFELSSTTPGTAELTITIDNTVKLKPVTIQFISP